MASNFLLFAPGIHTGGGLVLLQTLLSEWRHATPLIAILDSRARNHVSLPQGILLTWVAPTLGARARAEYVLSKLATRGDTVLCFHGLPPQLPNAGRILVFHQNALHLQFCSLRGYPWKTRTRLMLERLVARMFRHRVAEHLVQTPTMKRAVIAWYGKTKRPRPIVRIVPFTDIVDLSPAARADLANGHYPEWDFIYVADGQAHKNHRVLLEAWRELAREGHQPSLAITLGTESQALLAEIERARDEIGIRMHNLGKMSRTDVMSLYTRARALIFPSTSESFGLPLLEAAQMRLPILASELDFTRDVCSPVETFDPNSPVSVARAVKRFLGIADSGLALRTGSQFWREVMEHHHEEQQVRNDCHEVRKLLP